MDLEKTVEELRNELADSQHAAQEEKHNLNSTIESLGAKDKDSSEFIGTLIWIPLIFASIRQQNHVSRNNCRGNP